MLEASAPPNDEAFPRLWSGAGTQQRATCWTCACWSSGSPSTARAPRPWADCSPTAGEPCGGLWAVTSCWSRANMLCYVVLSITGTPPPQRGLVIPAPSTLPLPCGGSWSDCAVCPQPAGADPSCWLTCWWFTAADW